jgi:hypothetical protein
VLKRNGLILVAVGSAIPVVGVILQAGMRIMKQVDLPPITVPARGGGRQAGREARGQRQDQATQQEVADAALRRGPKAVRPFTEGEIKTLRMALHKNSTIPELRHKASVLMNDRADLLARAAKRGGE